MDALLTPPESALDQPQVALYERDRSLAKPSNQAPYRNSSLSNAGTCPYCGATPSQAASGATYCGCTSNSGGNISQGHTPPDEHSYKDTTESINWIGSEDLRNGSYQSNALSPNLLDGGPLTSLDVNLCGLDGRPEFMGTALGKHGRVGRYYTDGGGGRLPKNKKRRLATDLFAVAPIDVTADNTGRFSFPEIAMFFSGGGRINRDVYQAILGAFHQYCGIGTIYPPHFDNNVFPSLSAINHMIDLYITHLHPLLPMIHLPTLDLNRRHWVLALSLATCGATFLKHPDSRQLVIAMQEFLRRVVITLANFDTGMDSKLDHLCLAQAQLLRCISGFYSGNDRLRQSAFNARSAMCAFCQDSWALPDYIEEDRPEGHDSSFWLQWTFNESVRRTGFAIWLLDGMLAYHMDCTPLLTLESAKVPLPCPEILFEANSAREWIVLSKLATPMPSLIVATELLYSNKHVSIIMGEYSRVLLMHAVLHRTWEVERYARQPLSHYIPASIGEKPPTSPSLDRWLSANSLVAGWQSAACECFDVLHTDANACANAQNKEHPTILHLHVARMVLLAPCQAIQKLALHVAGTTTFASATEESRCRAQILEWVRKDRWKSRLSTIHAGSLFWHIRRYSANGFYEPAAVYLASLVLWAYAFFKPPGEPAPEPAPDADPTEPGQPSVINLDRPPDDELAQEYILNGDAMRAFLTGVGDLGDRSSPHRVAERGQKLLRTLTTWGYAWRYIDILSRLANEAAVP